MLLAALPALAQQHVKREGRYVVRADALAKPMRGAHGIPADLDRGVLQVGVVQHSSGRWRKVLARLGVSMRGPLGVVSSLQMRRVESEGGVSYLGVYHVLSRSVPNCRTSAQPDAARTRIGLIFTDRLGSR